MAHHMTPKTTAHAPAPRARGALLAFSLAITVWATSPAFAQPDGARPPEASTEAVLLEQARFWTQEGRLDLALQSLTRVLDGDPDSIDALYELGVVHLRRGDLPGARASLLSLQRLPGAQSEADRLKADIDAASLDARQIEEARRLAAAGDYDAAVRVYDRVFSGVAAPRQFAIEYYLTMAGLEARWLEARRGLENLARGEPQAADLALALATVLSYREDTRRAGLRQMHALAGQPAIRKDALDAMRDGLLWLGARPEDATLFEEYLALRPDDAQIQARLESVRNPQGEALVAMLRREGYGHLEAGDIAAAEQSFTAALEENDQDAGALAGLGIVRGRQEQFSEAAELLRQAIRRDPENRADFIKALDSVSFWADMQDARRAKSFGEFDTARQLLADIKPADEEQRAELSLLRGELALDMKHWTNAQRYYAEALEIAPENGPAFVGLLTAFELGGDGERIEAFLQSPQGRKGERFGAPDVRSAAAKARGWLAAQRHDVAAASSWYAVALQLAPGDPWARLEAARLHAAAGRQDEAEALFAGADISGDSDFVLAAAMYQSGEGRWGRALALLESVPAAQRTAPTQQLLKRARLRQDIERAMIAREGLGVGETRQALMALYAPFETHPDDTQLLAAKLIDIGAGDNAIALLRQAADQRTDAEARALADTAAMMVAAGDLGGAKAVFDRLQRVSRTMPADDRQRVAQAYDNYSVALARDLMAQRDYPRAADQVGRVLASNPVHGPALRTLAEIKIRMGAAREGLNFYRMALDVDPGDRDALRGVVGAAIDMRLFAMAADILDAALIDSPEEPQVYRLIADLAKATGDIRTAIDATEMAKRLEADQPDAGMDADAPMAFDPVGAGSNPFRMRAPTQNGQPAAVPMVSTPADAPRLQPIGWTTPDTAHDRHDKTEPDRPYGAAPLLLYVEPDPYSAVWTQDTPTPHALDARLWSVAQQDGALYATASDAPSGRQEEDLSPDRFRQRLRDLNDGRRTLPTTRETPRRIARVDADYDWELASLRARDAAHTSAGLGFRYRTGDEGLSQLTEFSSPFTFSIPAGGRLELTAEPVFLSAGTLEDDPFTLRQLGLLATIDPDARTPDNVASVESAGGVGFSTAYRLGALSMDVGVTPVGFEAASVVGGIALRHTFESGFTAAVAGSRRAVRDSVLSYAGAEDPLTGDVFGGMVDNRLQFELGIAGADSSIYLNGAVSVVQGHFTEDNIGYQADMGANFDVLQVHTGELSTGVNLTYFGYEENQRFFSLGHGGYFSPQNFLSATVPLTFTQQNERMKIEAGGAIGIQYFQEDAADFFPGRTDLQLQALDVAIAEAVENNLQDRQDITYDANRQTSLAVRAGVDFEYKLTPAVSFTAHALLDRSADWTQITGRFGLKYHYGAL